MVNSPTFTSPAITQTRHDPRHCRLHESRTGTRQAGGQARRHLGVRLRPVRDVAGRAPSTVRRSPRPSPPCSGRTSTGRRCRRPRRRACDCCSNGVSTRSEDAPARHRRGARRARDARERPAGGSGEPAARLAPHRPRYREAMAWSLAGLAAIHRRRDGRHVCDRRPPDRQRARRRPSFSCRPPE